MLILAAFFVLRAGDGPVEAASPGADAPAAQAATSGDGGEAGHGEGGDHEEGGGHGGPIVMVLAGIVIILLAAKAGGEVAERLHMPAVLGELVAGVILGNLALVGYHGLDFLAANEGIVILAEIGVVLLLFEVGLESNVKEMLSVGASSALVAILGVVAPFFLGLWTSAYFLPDEETLVHVFIGATLCATSVGITARVLADLGKVQARESKIILGAAVIDDVLGLVILAVVSGVITATDTGAELATGDLVMIIVKAAAFLVGAILIGSWLSPRMFRLASRLRIKGMLLTLALVFCFFLSYLAAAIDLATIVGAFAAGLILDEVHFREFLERGDHTVEELIHPITIFLVPIFFVLMGIRVDLSTFGEEGVLGFALVLSVAAIVGKMICALGVVEKGLDRISVAVGMVPRGEVGLIFASIGAALVLHGEPVISSSIYSAVVIMVIVTTLMTPPVLKLTLARGDRIKAKRGGGGA
ncbi:MAG: cation:proton antiporter [Thermoanaerobaculia bacterium]|nr:cation:proton antiporter [Thermoanaerobaculia bacterium]